jgi:hypothetical protein
MAVRVDSITRQRRRAPRRRRATELDADHLPSSAHVVEELVARRELFKSDPPEFAHGGRVLDDVLVVEDRQRRQPRRPWRAGCP